MDSMGTSKSTVKTQELGTQSLSWGSGKFYNLLHTLPPWGKAVSKEHMAFKEQWDLTSE